jgi:hypothetical protein
MTSFLGWYEEHHGLEDLRAAIAEPGSDLGDLDPDRPFLGILPSAWYPAPLAHAILDRATEALSEPERDALAAEAGRAAMIAVMTGLQKLAFSILMNPPRYRRYVQRIWDLNYGSGEIEVQDRGETGHLGIIRAWQEHHPVMCRMIVAGKGPIYETMGCKDVVVRPETCISHGAEHCSSSVQWR